MSWSPDEMSHMCDLIRCSWEEVAIILAPGCLRLTAAKGPVRQGHQVGWAPSTDMSPWDTGPGSSCLRDPSPGRRTAARRGQRNLGRKPGKLISAPVHFATPAMAPVPLSSSALTCSLTTNHPMPSGAEGGLALALSGKAGAESGRAVSPGRCWRYLCPVCLLQLGWRAHVLKDLRPIASPR